MAKWEVRKNAAALRRVKLINAPVTPLVSLAHNRCLGVVHSETVSKLKTNLNSMKANYQTTN